MSRHPEVLWAQRSDKVYLTIALPDAKNVLVKAEANGLFSFSALGIHDDSFNFSLEFYGGIVPENNKISVGLRNIFCIIPKEQKGWWKRLVKLDGKPPPFVKVDWNKWCDEDEEESSKSEAPVLDAGDVPLKRAQDDEDSDDDGMLYLPDLEKARDD